jgi:ADP-heptose:LPS heptosyltransferase
MTGGLLRSLARNLRQSAENVFLRHAASTLLAQRDGTQGKATRADFLATGDFTPFRQRWWMQWQLEPLRNRLRYVALCERARVLNALDRETRAESKSARPRKAVFIQFGHLGDIIHTIPALKALRDREPKSEIRLLTGPWNRELAERIRYVDRVLYHAPRWESYLRGRYDLTVNFRAEWEFALSLRRERADVAVDCTSGSMPTLFLMQALRPDCGMGPDLFPGGNFEQPDWYRASPYDSRCYEALRVLGLLSPLGIVADRVELEFPVTESDRSEVASLSSRHGLDIQQPFVVLAPGAGWPGKMWPSDRFGELGRRIAQRYNYPIVVIGGRSERQLADEVAGRAAHNLAGETSLGALGALLERARLVVTNDSGPYHIAAALKTPTVLLFGPGVVTKWARPDLPTQRILHHEVGCRCFPWHPRARCEYDRACMQAISVDEVWSAVTELLQ